LPGVLAVHDLHVWTITSGLVALSGHVVAADGEIHFSDDGGEVWQRAHAPAADGMSDLAMADAERGWAVGHGAILRTEDGGASWRHQRLPGDASRMRLAAVAAIDADRAVALGAAGYPCADSPPYAFNVDAGLIEPIDGSELFFNDRFYLGGENSVRGFRFRSIWVRDSEGNTVLDQFGTPIGGDRFLRANGELIVLVGGPFRVIGFADTGGVFLTQQGFDFDQMRVSTGLELQVNVPLFGAPLRFIYAQNVDPLPDDRFETFQFSIGPSF